MRRRSRKAGRGLVAGRRLSHYVDEDVDATNLNEVLWAMTTLALRLPPEKNASGDWTRSRSVIDAVRPWHWRDKFPMVNRTVEDQRDAMVEKYKDVLPLPRM